MLFLLFLFCLAAGLLFPNAIISLVFFSLFIYFGHIWSAIAAGMITVGLAIYDFHRYLSLRALVADLFDRVDALCNFFDDWLDRRALAKRKRPQDEAEEYGAYDGDDDDDDPNNFVEVTLPEYRPTEVAPSRPVEASVATKPSGGKIIGNPIARSTESETQPVVKPDNGADLPLADEPERTEHLEGASHS
jgi:hypothetical protein